MSPGMCWRSLAGARCRGRIVCVLVCEMLLLGDWWHLLLEADFLRSVKMPTRVEILKTLANSQERLLARYRAFTPQELDCSCTESATPGRAAWRPQDHLAHLAMIERKFQAMIHRTLQKEPDPV